MQTNGRRISADGGQMQSNGTQPQTETSDTPPAPPAQAKPPKKIALEGKGWRVRPRLDRWQAHVLLKRGTKDYATSTHDTAELAVAWCEATKAKLVLGLKIERARQPEVTLKRAGELFIEYLQQQDSAPAHLANARRILKHAVEFGLGNLLDDGFAIEARRFIASLKRRDGKSASQGTKNSYITTLRSIGNFAVKERKIDGHEIRDNPFDRVEKLTVTKGLKALFDLDELRVLVDPKHREHPFYLLFCTMLYGGMRIGEASKIDWGWFAWKDGLLAVHSSRRARAELQEGELRTKTSRARYTQIMPEFERILKSSVPADAELPKEGKVFPGFAVADRSKRRRHWYDYLKHCGIEAKGLGLNRTPHSCRHVWTCLALASGEDPTRVQHHGGWSDKDMRDHYAAQKDRYLKRVREEGWKPGDFKLLPPPAPEPVAPPAENVIAGPGFRKVGG